MNQTPKTEVITPKTEVFINIEHLQYLK